MDVQYFKIVIQWRLDKITLSLLPNPRDEKPERIELSSQAGFKGSGHLRAWLSGLDVGNIQLVLLAGQCIIGHRFFRACVKCRVGGAPCNRARWQM